MGASSGPAGPAAERSAASPAYCFGCAAAQSVSRAKPAPRTLDGCESTQRLSICASPPTSGCSRGGRRRYGELGPGESGARTTVQCPPATRPPFQPMRLSFTRTSSISASTSACFGDNTGPRPGEAAVGGEPQPQGAVGGDPQPLPYDIAGRPA
eukprot:TRINITY_DN8998_c0_g1_i3.p2 TRINITY_DN8998_c0_g1~~TRINITY_DN8998_c0_g1_i3.p2  ORF type:complete len:154 (-),score=7.15 TRINITY_DN8998_c0_g1_i3:64-525(-)